MDITKTTFLVEINELLEKLEASLLALENNQNDEELIEDIFRSMHTIKGSSSMFGFEKVSGFVHNLESIYDRIREGKLPITKDLLNVSLHSLDHLRKIIDDHEITEEANVENHNTLSEKILAILDGNYEGEGDQNAEMAEPEDTESTTYHILFQPSENILNDGTNPLYLLEELTNLGNCEIFPRFQALEKIEDLIPTNCYAYWEIVIATKVKYQELLDVFIFVENDSKIQIEKICDFDLINSPDFFKFVKEEGSLENADTLPLDKLKIISKNKPAKETKVREDKTEKEAQPVVKLAKANQNEKAISSIRVASDKLDSLMNIVSELVTTQAALSLFAETNHSGELETISENVEKLSRQLRDVAFGMTLIPIKNIMPRFQRLVRDVSADLGKKVDFITDGDETELDKNIIESLTDPLMHILRNSLDHGIEKTEDRISKGKPENGTITMRAFYSGASVNIQIKDDGKGIDTEAIRNKAIAKELIREDAILSEKELFDLIFHPGFSTAQTITGVSGRGVGMDVVKRNISNLRGEIEIESHKDKGTTLTIKLPLTLSIIDGLLVDIANNTYVIPLSVVEKCYEIPYAKLQDNFNKLVVFDDEQVPFLNLRDEFLLSENPPEIIQMIVVNNEDRKVALSVDHVMDEYQAVLKPLGKHYAEQDFISGGTILGDGSIALVLDTNRIIGHFAEA
ncbi:MAG: chemotaxis protein CheA [Bacteroidota bacterium]